MLTQVGNYETVLGFHGDGSLHEKRSSSTPRSSSYSPRNWD